MTATNDQVGPPKSGHAGRLRRSRLTAARSKTVSFFSGREEMPEAQMAAPQVGSYLAAHEPFPPASGACHLACGVERGAAIQASDPSWAAPVRSMGPRDEGATSRAESHSQRAVCMARLRKEPNFIEFYALPAAKSLPRSGQKRSPDLRVQGSHSGRLRVENVDRPIVGGSRKVGRKALIS
jgi:hypothetical protein